MKRSLTILFTLMLLLVSMAVAQTPEIEKKNAVFVGWSYEDSKSDFHFGFSKNLVTVNNFKLVGVGAIDPSKDGSGDAAMALMYSISPSLRVGTLVGVGFDAQTVFGTESPTLQQLVEATLSYGTGSLGYVVTLDLTKILKQPVAISGVSKKRWGFEGGTQYVTGVDYYVLASWMFGGKSG